MHARDEGLPLPAAIVLMSPLLDLTFSGPSFARNDGIDLLFEIGEVEMAVTVDQHSNSLIHSAAAVSGST